MRHFYIILLSLFSLACFSQVTINITLNPRDTRKTIPSDFAGLSFEKDCLKKGYFSSERETLITLFQTCGIKSMRVGGNSVDEYTLSKDSTGTDTTYTRAELDNLFHFAEQARCKILMGLNLGGDSNPSHAAIEANYVIQKNNNTLFGFEVGNEPDLYDSNGYRKSWYTVTDYETEYKGYYAAIKHDQPTAVFTGPASASHHKEFTEPFCRAMNTIISMLTQHNYGGVSDTLSDPETVRRQIDTLLNREKLRYISSVADSLVKYADSIPFRMSECNSFDHGGQKGVSNAFVSALWALDYMYKLAYDGCAGVNFHGGLEGPYTVFSKKDNIYSARPIAYGILAFQIGSKGKFIASTGKNDSINLDSYSVIDSSNNIYTTIINKDTLKYAVINLAVTDTVNSDYLSAEFVRLSSPSLRDTIADTLGGQVVNSNGTIPAYNWLSLAVSSHKTQIPVPKGSAVVIKFNYKNGNSINDHSEKNKHFLNLYPNPASEKVTIITDVSEHSVIFIYNLQGQILLQQQMQQGKTDIDISELAKGVYIVRLYSNARVEAGRIIKE